MEQVSHFNFLGCDISYEYENGVNNKLNKYQMMCDTTDRNIKEQNNKKNKNKIL